eukprot:gene50030-24586_t
MLYWNGPLIHICKPEEARVLARFVDEVRPNEKLYTQALAEKDWMKGKSRDEFFNFHMTDEEYQGKKGRLKGSPAVVLNRYGKGWVLLFSAHPELSSKIVGGILPGIIAGLFDKAGEEKKSKRVAKEKTKEAQKRMAASDSMPKARKKRRRTTGGMICAQPRHT